MPAAYGIDILRGVAASPPRRSLSIVATRWRDKAIELAQAEGLVDGAYSYRIARLEGQTDGLIAAEGERLPLSPPQTGEMTAIACGVATLGAALEERVHNLFAEGRRSLALAVDSLGNEMLLAVSRRMQDRMLADTRRLGLTMGDELRAGDPGLALDAQPAVLRLARGNDIGVRLTDTAMMYPMKTSSVVCRVGVALEAHWSRCDQCASFATCTLTEQRAAAPAV